MRFIYIITFLLLSNVLFAQQKWLLSGIIKDEKGEVLPGVGVYISGYKIATVTNSEGYFGLSLPAGNYDLLIKMIGFNPLNKNVIISNQSIKLELQLAVSVIVLDEVVVKPDANRERYINIFKQYFIGTTPNAAQCKILNPSVLKVNYDKDLKLLSVSCDDFLVIENKALGYKIKYLISEFKYDWNLGNVYYEGYPYFDDLAISNSQKKKFGKVRLKAYHGSSQHFFKTLYNDSTTTDGFVMNKLMRKPNLNRLPDTLINAQIKKFQMLGNSSNHQIAYGDSLKYWYRKKNEPKQVSYLIQPSISKDTLVHTYNNHIKFINFTDLLVVAYTKEPEDPSLGLGFKLSISKMVHFNKSQISIIAPLMGPIFFYANGSIYNPKSTQYEGYWAWEKVAESLPLDYDPLKDGLK